MQGGLKESLVTAALVGAPLCLCCSNRRSRRADGSRSVASFDHLVSTSEGSARVFLYRVHYHHPPPFRGIIEGVNPVHYGDKTEHALERTGGCHLILRLLPAAPCHYNGLRSADLPGGRRSRRQPLDGG